MVSSSKIQIATLALGAAGAAAQYSYVPVNGTTTARSACFGSQSTNRGAFYQTATPSPSFKSFAFTQTAVIRTASPVATFTLTPTFAPAYSVLSTLVPNATTTSYGSWNPNGTNATDTSVKYGQAAWTSLWQIGNPVNFTRGSHTTTVSPTPVATAELVYPDPPVLDTNDCYYFPKGFMFGVAGSATQIEGAIADEGKTPVVTDLSLSQGLTSSNYIADDNYWLYKQDINRLAAIGVKYYSFTISWARILPFSHAGSPVNQAGLRHYDDLINYCLSKGIQPVVTLYHTDTPLALFDGNRSALLFERSEFKTYVNGGFQLDNFVEDFAYYGKLVMTHFADRVPMWVTFNEPWYAMVNGKAVYNLMKAHATVYRFYHENIKGAGKVTFKQGGPIGLPYNPSNASDVQAAQRYNAFYTETLANPIFLGHDYPQVYKDTIKDYVPLNSSDLAFLNGTADIYAQDLYTANLIQPTQIGGNISACATNATHPDWPYCVFVTDTARTGWNIGLKSNSYGFLTPRLTRIALNYVWNTYKTPVMLTEFGFPVYAEAELDLSAERYDTARSEYYRTVLAEALAAVWEDGVDFRGAFMWSFLDNVSGKPHKSDEMLMCGPFSGNLAATKNTTAFRA